MQLSKGTNISKKRKSFPTSSIKFQSRRTSLREKIKFLREFARETAGKVNGLELRLFDDFGKCIFFEKSIFISKYHELLERIMNMLNDHVTSPTLRPAKRTLLYIKTSGDLAP